MKTGRDRDSPETERRNLEGTTWRDDDQDYNDQGTGWRTVSEHTTTATGPAAPAGVTTTSGVPLSSSHQDQSMWERTKGKAHEMRVDASEKMGHLKNKMTGRDDEYTTRRDNW